VLGNLFSSSSVFELFVFVIPLYIVLSIQQLLKAILQGFFLFRTIAFTSIIASFSNFILILVLVLHFKGGVAGLVYAKVISMGLASCFAYFSIPIKRKLEWHIGVLRKILVFGLPLQINDILTFIFLRIDTLLIASLLGPASIAYYEIGRKIPESLGGLYEAFRYVYFPLISRLHSLKEHEKLTELMNNSVRLISFASIFGALIALVFGKEIIVLLFSEQYLPSVTIFVLLMVGLNLAVVEYTFGYSLVAIGDSDKPLIVNIVRTCISLAGNLIFIPIFGAVGAAFANIAGNSITSPIDVIFLRRRKIEARIGDYLKPIIIFGVISGLYLIFRPDFILIKLVIIVLYLVICKLFMVVSSEDLTALTVEIKMVLHKLFKKSHLEVSE
jgi:O-antigen/teichoic acid export membrane protein